jgi:hypothetical protein
LCFECEVVVSSDRSPDGIVLVEPFVHPHEVENPFLEEVKYAKLHCIQEVGFWAVNHDTGNMSKHIEYSVNLGRPELRIISLDVQIAEGAIYVVIPQAVMLVKRNIISICFLVQSHQKLTCRS